MVTSVYRVTPHLLGCQLYELNYPATGASASLTTTNTSCPLRSCASTSTLSPDSKFHCSSLIFNIDFTPPSLSEVHSSTTHSKSQHTILECPSPHMLLLVACGKPSRRSRSAQSLFWNQNPQ